MVSTRDTAADDDLRSVLRPWITPRLDYPGGFRFHDAPPDVVRRALRAVAQDWSTTRPNGQPPGSWLVSTAERLGGLLAGQAGHGDALRPRLRVDAICVSGDRARELAQSVENAWPQIVLDSVALDLAVAEGWDVWDAEEPTWTGTGRELLEEPPDVAVVGLWWD